MKTRRRRNGKAKGRSRRGGRLVSQGSFGCGFSPALRCANNAAADPTLFSKFMDEDEAAKELASVKRVAEIDPDQRYSLYATKSCELNPENLNTWSENFAKCKLILPDERLQNTYRFFRVLQMPKADMDLFAYCQAMRGVTLSQLRGLFGGIRNLLEGLKVFHAAGFYHMDIKATNIAVSDRGALCRFIDFGLSSSGDFLKNYKALYFAYPFELQLHGMDFSRAKQLSPFLVQGRIDAFYDKHGDYVTPYNSLFDETGKKRLTPAFVSNILVPTLMDKPTSYSLEKTDVFGLGQLLSMVMLYTHGFVVKNGEPYFLRSDEEKEVPHASIFYRFYAEVYERLHELVLEMTDPDPEERPSLEDCIGQYDEFLRAFDLFVSREPAASPQTLLGKRKRNENTIEPPPPSSTTPSFLKGGRRSRRQTRRQPRTRGGQQQIFLAPNDLHELRGELGRMLEVLVVPVVRDRVFEELQNPTSDLRRITMSLFLKGATRNPNIRSQIPPFVLEALVLPADVGPGIQVGVGAYASLKPAVERLFRTLVRAHMLRDGAEMSDIYLRETAQHLQQLYAAAMTVRFLEQQLLPRIMDAEDAWVDPDVNLEVLRVFDQDPNDVAANLPEMVVAPNTSNVIHEDVEEGNVVALLKPGFEEQMLVVRKRNGSATAGRNYLHTRRQNPMTRESVDPMGLSYRRVTVR